MEDTSAAYCNKTKKEGRHISKALFERLTKKNPRQKFEKN